MTARGRYTKVRRSPSNRRDGRGRVKVQLFLANEMGSHTKGNVTRSFGIQDARVSEIAKWLEARLFAEMFDPFEKGA